VSGKQLSFSTFLCGVVGDEIIFKQNKQKHKEETNKQKRKKERKKGI
jgi:hypothetical protein